MILVRVIDPPEAIVMAEEAKRQLRIAGDDDDELIDGLIAAAQAEIEPPTSWIGRAFGVQTLEMLADGFGEGEIVLRHPPIRSIVSVKYDDTAGVEQTLDPSQYRVAGLATSQAVMLSSSGWPSTRSGPGSVRIRYTAGYDPEDPQLLSAKQALLLAVGQLYRMAGSTGALRRQDVAGVGSREFDVSSEARLAADAARERLLRRYRVHAV